MVRSAKRADGEAVQQFVRELSPLARRRRFFGALSELSPAQLERLTGAQNPRDLSLVALSAHAGEPRIVAMAQYATDNPGAAEFAVVVADAWQRQGLGARLLELMLGRAAEAGVQVLKGFALAENAPMLALAARLGFALTDDRDPDLVRLERPLPPSRGARWVADRLRQFVACRPVAVAAPAFAVQAR
ncbi:MAG TPA: GNAT family N-acetyltransferase [Burkholderiales bacterium]|nr:GNAT family N-acetyltransferase [Burkholderiales bacterium]